MNEEVECSEPMIQNEMSGEKIKMGPEKIKEIGVIGAGTMGHGIAQVFAQSGYDVHLQDADERILQKSVGHIKDHLQLFTQKEVVTPREAEATLSRIKPTLSLTEAAISADFVIETVFEDLNLKKRLFKELDGICSPSTILASNTSGLSIDEIAALTKRQDRSIVMHFVNPPYLIPVVELVRGSKTTNETAATARELVITLGKKPILCNKVVPGYILNRLQFSILREVFYMVENGIATPEDIDTAMEAGIGFRYPFLGPLRVADLGGLDVFYNICKYLFNDLSQSTEPPEVLRKLVETGNLGVKTGKGFYDYSNVDVSVIIRHRDEQFIELLKILELGGVADEGKKNWE